MGKKVICINGIRGVFEKTQILLNNTIKNKNQKKPQKRPKKPRVKMQLMEFLFFCFWWDYYHNYYVPFGLKCYFSFYSLKTA
jgi:hypothetical protein